MNQIFFLSVVAFIYMSYKFITVFKNKEVSKNNKFIAWSLYGLSIIGLISVNLLF